MGTCGTMFIREQERKGIAYRFFSLDDGTQFSMGIDAGSYPKEYWDSYQDAVECFINSLTNSLKEQFWLKHKEDGGFVDWNMAIKSNLSADTNFDSQLINNFIDDFILEQLTYEPPY
jgi:hypothetical protein